MFEHALDVGQEAHVQHAIGFVQDQVFQSRQLRIAVLKVVEQASGSGHDDVDALPEGLLLSAHLHPAVDGGPFDRGVPGQRVQVIHDLESQLTSGGQDQRSGRAPRLVQQLVQDG